MVHMTSHSRKHPEAKFHRRCVRKYSYLHDFYLKKSICFQLFILHGYIMLYIYSIHHSLKSSMLMSPLKLSVRGRHCYITSRQTFFRRGFPSSQAIDLCLAKLALIGHLRG